MEALRARLPANTEVPPKLLARVDAVRRESLQRFYQRRTVAEQELAAQKAQLRFAHMAVTLAHAALESACAEPGAESA